MSFDLEHLYELLPAFYRLRDIAVAEQAAQALAGGPDAADWEGLLTAQEEAERQQLVALRQSLLGSGEPFPGKDAARLRELEDKRQRGPLKALLSVLAEQVAVLEEDLEQLYDDQFIETCAEWVVPYIGDLVGTRGLVYYPKARRLSQRAQVANTLAYRRRKGTASVLEQLARDVTEWDASVVEYFQLLSTTQYMNHVRPTNLSFTGVRHRHFAGLAERLSGEDLLEANGRQWSSVEFANTPFDSRARTADVRNVERRRGKYNIPNVGIHLWRVGSFPVTDAPAYKVPDIGDPDLDGRRFLFNAAGRDTQLYNRRVTEEEISHLAEFVNVPFPLGRRVLAHFLEDFYGREEPQRETGKSVLIVKDGDDVEAADPPPPALRDLLRVCDLSDRLDAQGHVVGWEHFPEDRIAVDPLLGRIAFPSNAAPPERVRVNYHYGFTAETGGGEYGRAQTFSGLSRVIAVSKQGALKTVKEGLDELAQLFAADPDFEGGVVEIEDNDYYAAPLNVNVPAGKRLELRAADERRPTLVLDGDAILRGGPEAELILNGLLVASGALHVPSMLNNRPGVVRLRHCAVVPGATPAFVEFGITARANEPKLFVQIPDVTLEIDSCIVGAIRVHEGSRVRITNSIVDAGSPEAVAYAALGGERAGGELEIENSTVIGRVHTRRLEASNTIFRAGFAPGEWWPAPVSPLNAPVLAERVQEGCVRFCYVPPNSRVPRPFRCQPREPKDDKRVRPVFNSLRYGDATYCQLSGRTAAEIREGADDGAEMGAFHDLYQPQRVSNLRARLDEYLRFGLEAGIFYAS